MSTNDLTSSRPIPVKPLNVHITSLQRPLSAGRRTILKCQSSGSRPPATLTWWVGSRQLLNATVATYDSTTISKLAFVPVPEDHGRVMSCRATNPVMNGNILEDHRVLNIHREYWRGTLLYAALIFMYYLRLNIFVSVLVIALAGISQPMTFKNLL